MDGPIQPPASTPFWAMAVDILRHSISAMLCVMYFNLKTFFVKRPRKGMIVCDSRILVGQLSAGGIDVFPPAASDGYGDPSVGHHFDKSVDAIVGAFD